MFHPGTFRRLVLGALIMSLGACGSEDDFATELENEGADSGSGDASLRNGLGGGGARILRTGGPRFCLDAHKVRDGRTGKGTIVGPMQLWSCAAGERSGFNQRWTFGKDGTLFTADDYGRKACLRVFSYADRVVQATYQCDAKDLRQRWRFDVATSRVVMRDVVFVNGQVRTPICLSFPGVKHNGTAVGIAGCSTTQQDATQAMGLE